MCPITPGCGPVEIARRGVNDASTPAPTWPSARTLGDRCTADGAVIEGGVPVLDVLYAGVVIAVFAVLLLAVRGLDRR